jgi:hypothetical protein
MRTVLPSNLDALKMDIDEQGVMIAWKNSAIIS